MALETLLKDLSDTTASISGGTVVGFNDNGDPLVQLAGRPSDKPKPARVCVALRTEHIGSSVALGFLDGDVNQPVVLGILQPVEPTARVEPTITLAAESEVVIECGKASIVLTRAGKILLRGEFIASQSTGLNQIDGACVKIN